MKHIVRYHPALVALHWLVAGLVLVALIVGVYVASIPEADPQKLGVLRVHMIVGVLVLVLMLVRMLVRAKTARPPAALTGNQSLDWLARSTHGLFYVLLPLMAGTGLATAVLSGLNSIVFGNSGAPLPADLTIYPAFVAHRAIAMALGVFIALHVLAAAYHQAIRKDGLLDRMWFSKQVDRSKGVERAIPGAHRR